MHYKVTSAILSVKQYRLARYEMMRNLVRSSHARFSLRSLLAFVSLAGIVMGFGRYGVGHAILAFLIIALMLIWYHDECRPPEKLMPFPWPLFAWTGIKCVLGGLFLAMAAAQLFEPVFAFIQPTFENIFSRCALDYFGWELRQGAMERIEQRLGSVLFAAAWIGALILIAARPRNVAARWAAPSVVGVCTLVPIPELVHQFDYRVAGPFLLTMLGTGTVAFVAGWIGDVIRARREAKIRARLEDGASASF